MLCSTWKNARGSMAPVGSSNTCALACVVSVSACACASGQLEMAKWLFSISTKYNQHIHISAGNEFAFRWACANGHLNVAKWLMLVAQHKRMSINISTRDDWAFRTACKHGHWNIVQWFHTLNPSKYNCSVSVLTDATTEAPKVLPIVSILC